MKEIRLKDLCYLNPTVSKKFKEKIGTFLPMEKVGVGSFNTELSLPYEQMSSGYTFMQNNDVIRAIVTPCFENNKGTLLHGLENGFAFGSTEFMCLRPKKINPKFLYYVTASEDFKNHALKSMKGVGGLRRINSKFSLNYTINNYSISQQTAIANYLDYHTGKIDKEISLLEQKVEKLDEYKQALIYETVTKGLDKNVIMKASGIEWIGVIPAHWEVKRVSDFFNSPKIITNPGRTDVLSLTLNGVIKKDIESNKGLSPESYDTYQVFKKNDLVFKLIDLANYQASRVGRVWKDGIMSSAYIRLARKKNTNVDYFFYQFFDLYKRAIFNMLGGNGVRSAINRGDLLKLSIVTPPQTEQQKIAEYLDQQSENFDIQKKLINKKIELIKEYKQSLIYEAVTGKINIGENYGAN